MRLGIDGRELAAGAYTGIGRYVIEVMRAATQNGWECLVYGDRATRLGGPMPGVTLRVVGTPWTQWGDQVSLPRQLARDHVSVFLSPYYKGPLWAPCPVVLTIHDLFFIGYPGRPRPLYDAVMTRLARLYARRAAAIIADSDYSKRTIVERLGVPAAKVAVIPVALGQEFTPRPFSKEITCRYGISPPYILYVGNFKSHKNLPRLIQAYTGLSKPLRETYQLVLAGGDWAHRPALEGLARSLGVADRVLLTGPIEAGDLPAVYSGCALFVLPSLEEGFGLPALEAMACGAPVIAANRAAIPEVVGDAAILFDPERVGAIISAMSQVLGSSEVADTLRERGLARVRSFSPDRTAGRVLLLLRAVGTQH